MMRIRSMMTASLLAALLATSDASAFNPSSHRRVVEVAVDAMLLPQIPPPTPLGTNEQQWRKFLSRLKPAKDRLNSLHTGLEAAPHVAAKPSPLGETPDIDNPEKCEYHQKDAATGRELNLLYAGRTRIEDFKYYRESTYNTCSYRAIDAVTPLGGVLGYHAGSIDARNDDQILTVRPTTVAFVSLLQEGATRITELALGSLFFPISCAIDLFDGGGFSFKTCSRDGFDLSRTVNPVEYLVGLVPGVGRYTNEDFGGFFHFIDVEAGLNNRYNSPRGLFYENAGPSYPGAVDVAIMAAADFLGVSMDPSSQGIAFYGQYDRVTRSDIQWQAHTIGHTEFSPVSHLGRFGWDNFDNYDASWLGFPLHAIGDAAAPHHVVGTTSWGHRPFEDAVANKEDVLLLRAGSPGFEAQQARVLAIAFGALRDFDADASIQNFVSREARGTRQLAKNGDDWVFQDSTSRDYITPGRRTESIDPYRNETERLRPFVEQAIGQTVAFLVKAGERSIGFSSFDELSLCPAGQYFTGEGSGCKVGTAPPPPNVSQPLGVAQTSCRDSGASCAASNDCCGSLVCTSGRCAAPGPTCAATNGACASSTDCCGTLLCTGGLCAAPPTCGAGGTSCAADTTCCAPLVCNSGSCGSHVCPGYECTASSQCNGSSCYRGCCTDRGPK